MNGQEDFNKLVELAMANASLSSMRPVVEKELLHYDIFHALDGEGLLKDLVFQGGTSLRLCRGSARFSEDLDFAGGKDFSAAQMAKIKACIETHIGKRYALNVTVKEPRGEEDMSKNIRVSKWMVAVETAPGNRSLPRQKIKLEIANVPAYSRELVPLMINYDFLAGMNQVLVPTESLSEIFADKVVAFPTSLFDRNGAVVAIASKKIRHRDIWDLAWLSGKRADLDPTMLLRKLDDYGITNYPEMLGSAIALIPYVVKSKEFKEQMQRFLDSATIGRTLEREGYLDYLASSVVAIFESALPYADPANAPSRSRALGEP